MIIEWFHNTIMDTISNRKNIPRDTNIPITFCLYLFSIIFLSNSLNKKWGLRGSNPEPSGYEPNALPIELRPHANRVYEDFHITRLNKCKYCNKKLYGDEPKLIPVMISKGYIKILIYYGHSPRGALVSPSFLGTSVQKKMPSRASNSSRAIS